MEEKACYLCGTTQNVDEHHVFFGTSNRKKSDKYGMKIYLCHNTHHLGANGVHNNRALDLELKREFQQRFEQEYSREKFIEEFGRNYL